MLVCCHFTVPSLEHLELKNNFISTVNLELPKLTNLELRDNALTTTAKTVKKRENFYFFKNSIELKKFRIVND